MRRVPVEPELAAKASLYMAMRRGKGTNVAPARGLGVTEGAVRSMLDPQRTAKIGTLAKALAVLDLEVTVSVSLRKQRVYSSRVI